MKKLLLIALFVVSGCTPEVQQLIPALINGASSPAQEAIPQPQPIISVTPTPSVTPDPQPSASPSPTAPPRINVTYHMVSKTVAPINGWSLKTYTAKGYCALHEGVTYCWDDGMQTIQSWEYNHFLYGPFYYTYWGLGLDTSNRLSRCEGSAPIDGGCVSDLMITPRIYDGRIKANIPQSAVTTVMAAPSLQASCTESSGILYCGDFTIDTRQDLF